MELREKLIALVVKYQGDYNLIQKAIEKNEEIATVQYKNVLTILDKEYPRQLLNLDNPPFVLFYKGNLALLKEEIIGVVGSRLPCEYALEATKSLCQKKKDKVIISGLAKGIDACAHQNATKTIGVIGCGIDYIYPYCNKMLYEEIERNGLILSEHPGLCPPYAYNFPFRNRIIAALSKEIYIMEAHEKSGTLTTINQANKLGIDVKVLPFDVFNKCGSFNNYLLSEGALFIEQEDLFIDKDKNFG